MTPAEITSRPEAQCLMVNCRNRAPADEAFCAKHRQASQLGTAHQFQALIEEGERLLETTDRWKTFAEDTAWLDGRDVILLAHDMEVQARYCPGEWSDDTPTNPREYPGAVWSCFDDKFQIDIEETSRNPVEWHHGPATHWRETTARPRA